MGIVQTATKQGGDETCLVDVEVGDEAPEAAVDVQCSGEQADDLDGADEERHGNGQAGDDQVVVHLADRAGERPSVGEVHEAAVGGVEQGYPPGEQQRQRQQGVLEQALVRLALRCGDDDEVLCDRVGSVPVV